MLVKTRALVKLTVFVAAGYAIYRGMRSFLRNEITFSITEVVHLPISDRVQDIDGQTSVRGEIQCETYLMRSYRFLMKLSANIKSNSLPPISSARSRPRVMRVTDDGSYQNFLPSSGSKRREGLPLISVDDVHCMVDFFELLTSGNICFTPTCIGDEVLMRYEASVRTGFTINAHVRSCYLQSDDTPGLKRLSFDLVVYDVVHSAKVVIELPNHYCDIVAIHTSGVGRIQQPNPRKPHHLVWEISTVNETTWKDVQALGSGVVPGGRLARRGFTDDDLAAAVDRNSRDSVHSGSGACFTSSGRLYSTRRLSIGTDPRLADEDDDNNNDYDYEYDCDDDDDDKERKGANNRESCGLPCGTHLLVAHFMLIFEEPVGVEYDYVSSDSSVAEDESTGGEARKKKSTAKLSQLSRKSMKREESASKKQLQCRSINSALTTGRGVSTRLPVVEFSYSVAGLASGLTVRKLQTVSDRPNWEAQSFLGRWLLRWIVPGIQQVRLIKYAHYATWLVQSVQVTVL